jgi:hypothetical protein
MCENSPNPVTLDSVIVKQRIGWILIFHLMHLFCLQKTPLVHFGVCFEIFADL